MKSIYLDIGNSFVKMASRNNAGWQIVFEGELPRFSELCEAIKSIEGPKELLISSVRKDITKKLNESLLELTFREYRVSDIPSRMLSYKTPGTLGLDRFLTCLGAAKESGERDVVVIDAGSACTVDLMTSEGVYSGGVIMPGIQLIRNAMAARLPELPAAPPSIPETWPGKSTTECIEWGVNGAFILAVQGFIDKYRSITEEIDIYVTGGDARQLIKWMGNEEALIYRKNLIWTGMEEFGELIKSAGTAY